MHTKAQADKKRTEPEPFHVDDRVYLATHYLQSLQLSKKLEPRFVGSFPIKHIINPATIELDLPKSLHRVHPVFHCSFLKPEISSPHRPVSPPVPEPLMIEGEQHFEVKEILDFPHMHRGNLQYLLVWKDFPSAQNEWVDHQNVRASRLVKCFHNQYPDKPK